MLVSSIAKLNSVKNNQVSKRKNTFNGEKNISASEQYTSSCRTNSNVMQANVTHHIQQNKNNSFSLLA